MSESETRPRVLFIDDNQELAHRANDHLTRGGYEVCEAYNGADGLRLAYEFRPDVIVLDIMMDGMDGWEVCRRLRELTSTPILFATAVTGGTNAVRGLDMGADGYINKMYTMVELQARIEAMLRRASGDRGSSISDGYLTIDLDNHLVQVDGKLISLGPKEYQVLACLVSARGQVVRHEDALLQIWGEEYRADRGTLAIHISRLRAKIEPDEREPQYIITRHGLGYEFSMPAAGKVSPR